ncbi:MAG: S8 family serine peptidase, partial [Janthinobacterium lividum]
SAADARICLDGSLDPAGAKGKVVVCERLQTARVAKSAEVARAGGAGMILVNPTPNSTEPDAHAVPTVHLDAAAGAKVIAYAQAHPQGTVSFTAGNTTGTPTPTPQITGFSSRGPTFVNGGDVLKPDVAAPGSGVLAGYSPAAPGARGNLFEPESGTSMSAPHVTGLAALYFTAHPDYSPMAVKSALMTTTRSLLDAAGKNVTDIFQGGAGFVDPTKMLNPGLVYESGALDWLRYIEGSGVDTGTGVGSIDPSELNQASIAVGDLAGTRTITRSVTATTTGLFYGTASVPGFDVTVSPSVLFMREGQTKQFRVTFTRTDAAAKAWTSGALTWKGAGVSVRSPIALRPVTVSAPAELSFSGVQGSADVTVTSGVAGDLDVSALGLDEGTTTPGTVKAGGEQQIPVTVPEGAVFSRFDLVSDDATADLDLYLFSLAADGSPTLVASSATASASERIDVQAAPGRYVLAIDGYAAAVGKDSTGYQLTDFELTPESSAGNLTVTPNPVPAQLGKEAHFTVSWSGLDPAKRYFGGLAYGDETTPTTLLSVN